MTPFVTRPAQLFEWFKLEASAILSACKAYKPLPNAPKLLAHTRNKMGTVSANTDLQVGGGGGRGGGGVWLTVCCHGLAGGMDQVLSQGVTSSEAGACDSGCACGERVGLSKACLLLS